MILVPTVIPTMPSAHATTQVRSTQSSTLVIGILSLFSIALDLILHVKL